MEDYPEESGTTSIPDKNPDSLLLFSSHPRYLTAHTGISSINSSLQIAYDNLTNLTKGEETGFDIDGETELPAELREMSESSKHCMIAYCILFVIATSGNLTVLISVLKQYQRTKSRMSLLILHLSIADLIVCCTLIPTEVFWRLTIQWRGGNVLCKMMQFLRAFGLYLSSMVLICVSFDRFLAILFPMKMIKRQGHQKIKIMLWIAWIASATFSTPQAILFSLAQHPEFPSFKQCVTNEFLKNTEDVRLYSIFSVSAMYFAPLFVILFTYTAILIKIIRKAHQNHEPQSDEQLNHQSRNERSRQSIRFRLSLRNPLRGGRHCESYNSDCSSGDGVHYQNPLSQHNRPNSTSLGSQGGSGRRQKLHHHHNYRNHHHHKHHHDSGISDQEELSSEDGSLAESICSNMHSDANSMSRSNNSSIKVRTSARSLRYSARQRHHQHSPTPDGSGSMGRSHHRTQTSLVLRRSDNAAHTMSRAKHRTLVMTIVIVMAFLLSWTPYVVMTLWYMFDWEGAKEVDSRVQDGLFVMAVANSCVNPLIYGTFAKSSCGLSKIFGCFKRNSR